jgi:hypothetical protein
MFSTLLMGGGGHAREKDHQNVKSLIIFARDCRSFRPDFQLLVPLTRPRMHLKGISKSVVAWLLAKNAL